MEPRSLSELVTGLRTVANCMAKDATRYAIHGVLAEPIEAGLRLVATDGHRLALTLLRGLKIEGLAKPVVLAGDAVKALMAKGKHAPVDLTVKRSGMVIKTAAGSLQFQHVDGRFPPYHDVIPTQVSPHTPPAPINPVLLESTTAWSESQLFKLFAADPRRGKPVLVLSADNPNWLAMIMPLDVPNAGIWTEQDGEAFKRMVGKTMTVMAAEPAEAPAVAGTVGLPARQAA